MVLTVKSARGLAWCHGLNEVDAKRAQRGRCLAERQDSEAVAVHTLVEHGVLHREPYREPGQRERHQYLLTEKGHDLFAAVTVGTAGPNTGAAAFNHAVWQPYSDHWVQLRTWFWPVLRKDHPMPVGLIDELRQRLAGGPLDRGGEHPDHLVERVARVRTR